MHSLLVLASYKFTWMFLKPFTREGFHVFSKNFSGKRLKNHFSKKNLANFSRICPYPISFPNLVHSLLVIASYKFTWMFIKAFPIEIFHVFSKNIFGNRLKNHFKKKTSCNFREYARFLSVSSTWCIHFFFRKA